MRLLDSCAGMRPDGGAALQARVWEAVRAHPQPPQAAVSQLLLALSPETFDPGNAVATKAVVAAVLSMQRAARADAARQLEEGGMVPLGQETHLGASAGLPSDEGGEAGTPRGGGSQQGTPRGAGDTAGGPPGPGGAWTPRTGGGTPSPDSSPVGAPRRAHQSQGSDDTFTSTPGRDRGGAMQGTPPLAPPLGAGLQPAGGLGLGTPGQRAPQGVAMHLSSPMSPGYGEPNPGAALGIRGGGATSGGGWTSPPPRARNSPRAGGQPLGASPQHTSDNVGGSAANAMSTVAPPFWAGRPPWGDTGVTCPSQLGGWPGGSREDAAAFMAALTAFCAQQAASASGDMAPGAAHLSGSSHSWSGLPAPTLPLRVPAFAGELLDVPGLYREVCMRGGGAAVTAAGLWPTVVAALHLPSTHQEACKVLTGHYARLLAAYEEAHFDASSAPDGAARHQQQCGRSGREGSGRGGSGMLASEDGGEGGYRGDHRLGGCEEGFSPRTGGSDSACTTSPGGRSVGGAGCRFTEAEDALIMRARLVHGNKWTAMEALLPGRSVGSIKKHWHSTLKYKEAALAALAARGSSGSMGSLGSGGSLNTLAQPPPADTQMHASTHALSAQLGVTALGGDYHGAALQRPGSRPGTLLGAPPRAVAARLSYGQQQLQQQLHQQQQQQHQQQMQQQQQQQQAAAMHVTGYGDVQASQFMHHGQQAMPVGPWYTAPQAAAAVHPGHAGAAAFVGSPPVGHTLMPGGQMLMPLLPTPGAPAWAAPAMSQPSSAAAAHQAHLSAVAASLGQLPQGISFTVGPGGTLYWHPPGAAVHPDALFNAQGG
jgi:hypothetical protein